MDFPPCFCSILFRWWGDVLLCNCRVLLCFPKLSSTVRSTKFARWALLWFLLSSWFLTALDLSLQVRLENSEQFILMLHIIIGHPVIKRTIAILKRGPTTKTLVWVGINGDNSSHRSAFTVFFYFLFYFFTVLLHLSWAFYFFWATIHQAPKKNSHQDVKPPLVSPKMRLDLLWLPLFSSATKTTRRQEQLVCRPNLAVSVMFNR